MSCEKGSQDPFVTHVGDGREVEFQVQVLHLVLLKIVRLEMKDRTWKGQRVALFQSRTLNHTVRFEAFIKHQLASRNQLWGLVW